jgi:hypothetical protein
MTKGIAIIDGDILAYRSAAANTRRFVTAIHNETLEEHEFPTATAFKEWAGSKADKYSLTPGQEADSLGLAIGNMKRSIESITKGAKCDSYHIVVSGKDNFRLNLPLPTRYKSNRDDAMRPPQLGDCKDYLVNKLGAEVSRGVEADDVLCSYAYQGYKEGNYVVQCSIDKDAHHGPWWLYDWTTMKEPKLIEGFGDIELVVYTSGVNTSKVVKGFGRKFLYCQMVLGDPVDGYKPSEIAKARFGAAGAYKLLKNAKNDKEALEAIVKQYKSWYPSELAYEAWDGAKYTTDWLNILQMYADCAFMRRWEGDRLDVKKTLDKLGVKY